MPGKTAKVILSERQQDILRAPCNAPTAPSQLRKDSVNPYRAAVSNEQVNVSG